MKTRDRKKTPKVTQRRPVYLETGAPGQPEHYLIALPWVGTSGSERSPFEYNNGAHAAVHSILGALICGKKRDVKWWLRQARRQIGDACNALDKPGARVVPPPPIHLRKSAQSAGKKSGGSQ